MGCCSSVDRLASSGARQLTVKPEEACDIVEYGTASLPPMQLRFSIATQHGCYPEAYTRKNQDTFLVRPSFAGRPELHLFGVFDGHGIEGHTASAYVRDQIESALESELKTLGLDKLGSLPNEVITDAIHKAYMHANEQLDQNSHIDDSFSGSTALIALVVGSRLVVANTGDSRAVWGRSKAPKNEVMPLSFDHNPYRIDEAQRVEASGGFIRTHAQKDCVVEDDSKVAPSLEIMKECDDSGDPPRVWDKDLVRPGCAFTRSIGDSFAKALGVIPDPEFSVRKLDAADAFFCLHSDGVSDFYFGEALVDLVAKHKDQPAAAVKAVADGVYKNWQDHAVKTDDTTIIVVVVGKKVEAKGKGK